MYYGFFWFKLFYYVYVDWVCVDVYVMNSVYKKNYERIKFWYVIVFVIFNNFLNKIYIFVVLNRFIGVECWFFVFVVWCNCYWVCVVVVVCVIYFVVVCGDGCRYCCWWYVFGCVVSLCVGEYGCCWIRGIF